MVQKAKVSNAFKEVFKSKPTATLLATTIRSLRCLELSASLIYCWVGTIILAEQNSRKSRIFNSNFTNMFYHCRIELFKKRVPTSLWSEACGFKFPNFTCSECHLSRMVRQHALQEYTPASTAATVSRRLSRTRVLGQVWHDHC